MTIKEKEQEIIDEFAIYDDWLEKYEHIIEQGKDLPLIDDKYKTDEYLIKGCQSQVWVHSEEKDGKMHFTGDSDAIITKGMISLLIRAVNGESPETVADYNFDFLKEIGLHEHLSPTRANGLLGMVNSMKMNAIKALRS